MANMIANSQDRIIELQNTKYIGVRQRSQFINDKRLITLQLWFVSRQNTYLYPVENILIVSYKTRAIELLLKFE